MDPNRGIAEAAQGNKAAEKIYEEFHDAIKDAKRKVKEGLICDFHGQVTRHRYFLWEEALKRK